MGNSVVIKGNKHGIVVVLSEELPYDELKEQVRKKFVDSSKFFGNANMALGFEGRELSFEQQQEIAGIISSASELNIVCLVDDDSEREKRFQEAVENAMYAQNGNVADSCVSAEETVTVNSEPTMQDLYEDDYNKKSLSEGQFYKGTLRSGQVFEAESSVIILGDINPGGRVIAKGNIIVLGSLKGNAFAGADGNENAFVVALDMDPMQIKIGEIIARSSDGAPRKKAKGIQPKIAFVENGNIYIENLDQDVIEDIRLS